MPVNIHFFSNFKKRTSSFLHQNTHIVFRSSPRHLSLHRPAMMSAAIRVLSRAATIQLQEAALAAGPSTLAKGKTKAAPRETDVVTDAPPAPRWSVADNRRNLIENTMAPERGPQSGPSTPPIMPDLVRSPRTVMPSSTRPRNPTLRPPDIQHDQGTKASGTGSTHSSESQGKDAGEERPLLKTTAPASSSRTSNDVKPPPSLKIDPPNPPDPLPDFEDGIATNPVSSSANTPYIETPETVDSSKGSIAVDTMTDMGSAKLDQTLTSDEEEVSLDRLRAMTPCHTDW